MPMVSLSKNVTSNGFFLGRTTARRPEYTDYVETAMRHKAGPRPSPISLQSKPPLSVRRARYLTFSFKIDSKPEPLFEERLTIAGHLDKAGNQYPSTLMPVQESITERPVEVDLADAERKKRIEP